MAGLMGQFEVVEEVVRVSRWWWLAAAVLCAVIVLVVYRVARRKAVR
jgi:hypothetical protein